MQRTLRTSLLVLSLAVIALAPSSHSSAADFSAIWDGGNGNWDDPLHWSTNPNYPNNGGGFTYNATINSGAVTLDRDIMIQRLFLNNFKSTIYGNGSSQLTLNEGSLTRPGCIFGSEPQSIWRRGGAAVLGLLSLPKVIIDRSKPLETLLSSVEA